MFKKNNLKNILLLAIGFFWCSSVYLSQEQYLLKYASVDFVNTAELLYGSLAMALGILTFGLIYKNNKNMKAWYLVSMILSIISMVLFFFSRNKYVMSIYLCLTCFFGTAGFGAGYHFSLLASEVDKAYRGRVFALGYALGSMGTYLLVLLPEKIYASNRALLMYIPVVLLCVYLVLRKSILSKVESEKSSLSFKKQFIRISALVLAMSLLSALSTDTIAVYTIDIPGGYGGTRIYYSLGLIIAGILVDKKNSLFEILTIASFVFSLLSIILLKDNYSINIVAALSYFFVGFFVLFRTMSFVNLENDKGIVIYTSAFGLMYSRIMEGLMVLFEDNLINHYTFLIVVIAVALASVIVIYFILYINHKNPETNKLKELSIKYKLSNQEEKVLNLLIEGKTNQEIADILFISVYTVKRHVSSIYKKTSMKKKELKEKCY